tara:strand:- start:744 stop:2009 length:1266 start_codon:yes stop_codon:yes gene_type:complete
LARKLTEPDPPPRRPNWKTILPEKSESGARHHEAPRERDSAWSKKSGDTMGGEAFPQSKVPLDEKSLFETELDDLAGGGSESASEEGSISSASAGETAAKVPRWVARAGEPAKPNRLSSIASEADHGERSEWELQGEAAWTGLHTGSLWWVLAGILGVGVVVVFLVQSFDNPVRPTSTEEPQRAVISGDISNIPIADLVIRAAEIMPMVTQVLEEAHSGRGLEVVPLLRGGKNSWERRNSWEDRRPRSGGYYPVSQLQLNAAALMGRPYLMLMGLDKDYVASVAYFTSEADGSFKYDWEASEGYSEILPGEGDQLQGNDPRLMRGIVTPSTFYPPAFPELEFQCYIIHHRDAGNFIWAFAKRGSEANKRMRGHFSLPLTPAIMGRATVRVQKGPKGARVNQLELVEFINSDWFIPRDHSGG